MQERLVDAGDGIRLMLHSSGSGAPPVICLSCAGGAHDEWSAVAARLASVTEIVTYGRPSLGGSDPLPAPLAGCEQSVRWAAAQLRTLLHNAGVAPPYVLLTSSVGSWIADQYAAAWPDEAGGIVLIDPTMASAWPQLGWEPPLADGNDEDPGCIRFDWDDCYAELARSVPPRRPRRVVISGCDGHWERDSAESRWYEPLTFPEVDLLAQASQREWARRLAGSHVIADTAGHFVHRDQPDLVGYVISAVVDAVRKDEPARLNPPDVAAAGGRIEPADHE